MYRQVSKEEFDEFFDKLKKECDEREWVTYPHIPIPFDELFINNEKTNQSNCLHDSCPECHGSGRKVNGGLCIHFISCPCPKCTPQ